MLGTGHWRPSSLRPASADTLPTAEADPYCLPAFRALFGYRDYPETVVDAVRDTRFETPVAAAYRRRFVTAAPENAHKKRVELLKRLGVLPPSIPAEPARIVRREEKPRHHRDGGYYDRDYDQFGDTYGGSIEGPSTYPILSRYFNLPQIHPHLPGKNARFLREAEANFPREKLTAQDLELLEPMPQRDPLKSYIGGALLRIFTQDPDKTMPRYSAAAEPWYRHGFNYFRRGDGTYYLYDLPHTSLRHSGFHQMSKKVKENFQNLCEAMLTVRDPVEKAELEEFYLDSILLFSEAGKEMLAHGLYRLKQKRDFLSEQQLLYQNDKRNPFFRLLAWAARNTGPYVPNEKDALGQLEYEVETYILLPKFMLSLHRERAIESELPGLTQKLEQRIEEDRARWRTLLDHPDIPDRTRKRLMEPVEK